MELDDMKLAWQDLNRELQEQREINAQSLSERKRDRARLHLLPLAIGQGIQVLIGIWMCLKFGSFWFNHLETPHLLVSGLLCHAFGLMLVVFAARELYMIFSIDFSDPVVSIQRNLMLLQTWRTRVGAVIIVASCFIWVPMLLFLLAWIGVDVLANDPNALYWLIANIIFSVVLMAGYLIWNRRAHTAGKQPTSEKPISNAQQALRDIQAFERQAE